VSANLRIDNANTGYFRIVIGKNGNTDINLGLHGINGLPSTNYDNLAVGGLIQLLKGQYVSVLVYSSADTSWHVQQESGFSGAYVGPLSQV